MGASGWKYVTPFEGTVEESLEALHAQVFQELYGDHETYRDLADLWQDAEFMGEEGTHSILDIDSVVHTSEAPSDHRIEDYGTLRPLAPQRLALHFGTDRPTPGQFEEALGRDRAAVGLPAGRAERLFDECGMRWTGRYVVLYTGDTPTHLGVFGFSGD